MFHVSHTCEVTTIIIYIFRPRMTMRMYARLPDLVVVVDARVHAAIDHDRELQILYFIYLLFKFNLVNFF